jgi:hypothetical protein
LACVKEIIKLGRRHCFDLLSHPAGSIFPPQIAHSIEAALTGGRCQSDERIDKAAQSFEVEAVVAETSQSFQREPQDFLTKLIVTVFEEVRPISK